MKSLLCFLTLILCINGQTLPSVGVVHGEYTSSYNTDVVAKLSPYFNITLVDAKSSTPSYDYISTFVAILTYCDGGYANPITLGSILKKYVDNGGGLVVAMYSLYYGSPNTLQGGFYPNYYLISPNSTTLRDGPVSMVINDASHPIMKGVQTFNGGSDSGRAGGIVNPGFETVASWQDSSNTPLVVAGSIKGVKRVDLNFFPTSSPTFFGGWPSTTDGAKIMANSLTWVMSNWGANCQSCTARGLMWCLDTNTCTAYTTTCPDRVTNPAFCPVTCSSYTSCNTCTDPSLSGTCEWCLDNSSCVGTKNTCQNVIHNRQFCKSPMTFN